MVSNVSSFEAKDYALLISGTIWVEAIGSMIMRSKKDQPIDESESDPRQDWLYIDISLPAYAGRAPIDVAETTPPPRLLRTHLSYELLPQSAIASKSKVYYIATPILLPDFSITIMLRYTLPKTIFTYFNY